MYTPKPSVASLKFLKSILNNFVVFPSAVNKYIILSTENPPSILTPANSHLDQAVCTLSPPSKKYLYINLVSALVAVTSEAVVYGAT